MAVSRFTASKGTVVLYCRLHHTLPAQRKGCAMVALPSMACTVKSNIILHPPPKKTQERIQVKAQIQTPIMTPKFYKPTPPFRLPFPEKVENKAENKDERSYVRSNPSTVCSKSKTLIEIDPQKIQHVPFLRRLPNKTGVLNGVHARTQKA